MMCTGSSVTLEIAKFAAVHYGLEEMLNQLPQEKSKSKSNGLEANDITEKIVCAPSTLPGMKGNHYTAKRGIRNQDKKWLKHRMEYRSNPNLACKYTKHLDFILSAVVF